jgi:hypothetical protein
MTTLRRIFETDDGQILVTVNVEAGEVIAATRAEVWDTWSHPLPEVDRQDDAERGRVRHTGPMLVVELADSRTDPPEFTGYTEVLDLPTGDHRPD